MNDQALGDWRGNSHSWGLLFNRFINTDMTEHSVPDGDISDTIAWAEASVNSNEDGSKVLLLNLLIENYDYSYEGKILETAMLFSEDDDVAVLADLSKMYFEGMIVSKSTQNGLRVLSKIISLKKYTVIENFIHNNIENYWKSSEDDSVLLELCRLSVSADDAFGHVYLARIFRDGRGVSNDAELSLEHMKLARESGITWIDFEYAELLISRGRPEDYETAFVILQYLSDKGNKDALFRLAQCYRNGIGVEKNLDLSLYYMDEAVKAGHKGAIEEINSLKKIVKPTNESVIPALWDMGTDDSLSQMISICEQYDSPIAHLYLAQAYRYGKGVDMNENLAVSHYLRTDMTMEIAEYICTTASFLKTIPYLRSQSTIGDKNASFRLAQLYRNRIHDNTKAMIFMMIAIEQGHKGAIKELSDMVETIGTKPSSASDAIEILHSINSDESRAAVVELAPFAIYGNSWNAALYLGIAFRDGIIVEKDIFLAEWLLRKAYEHRIMGAKKELDEINH